MISRKILTLIFAGTMALSSAAYGAEIVVREGPPRAVVERRGRAPGKDYVWIGGYQRWDGGHYVWEKGRWDRPPHVRARWIAPRWEHRRDGYVFVEGHWS